MRNVETFYRSVSSSIAAAAKDGCVLDLGSPSLGNSRLFATRISPAPDSSSVFVLKGLSTGCDIARCPAEDMRSLLTELIQSGLNVSSVIGRSELSEVIRTDLELIRENLLTMQQDATLLRAAETPEENDPSFGRSRRGR